MILANHHQGRDGRMKGAILNPPGQRWAKNTHAMDELVTVLEG
jgi:hypothetical protein